MSRSSRLLLGLGLAFAGLLAGGCIDDIKDDCRTDDDCGPGGRCVDDGVKFCVGPEGGSGGGEAGAGGTAGDGGGGGGAGGSAGEGGSGGSGGVELIPIDVPVVVHADGALADFLGEWSRNVREISVKVKVGDAAPFPHVLNDPPTDGYSLAVEEAITIPIPVEIEAGTTPEIHFEVETRAVDIDGSVLSFAVGTALLGDERLEELIAGAGSAEALAIPVAGGAFDFDRDLTPDLYDCRPNDPTIHPAALDVCDGVDDDCNPEGSCVVLLPEGQHALDVACANGHCVAAVDGVGETAEQPEGGSLIGFPDTSFAPFTLAVPDPRGVAMWDGHALAYDASAPDLLISSITGESPAIETRLASSSRLSGPLAVSPFGNAAFGLYANLPAVEFFNPTAALAQGTALDCGSGLCKRVSLSTLKEHEVPLAQSARPKLVQVRHIDQFSQAQLYVLFDNDSRLAIANIFADDGSLASAGSGLKTLFEGAKPKNMALNSRSSVLHVTGRDEASQSFLASLTTGSNYGAHGHPDVFALPEGFCAGALAAHGSTLWVADECNGRLMKLQLDESAMPIAPEGEPAFVLPHYRCHKPTHLAISDGASENPALLLACEGEEHMVVLGRD